jgi:hypothetical protein
MAGYSKRSLVEKLGIKPGRRALFVNAPPGFERTLGKLPPDVKVEKSLLGPLDFIHCFATKRQELEARFLKLKQALAVGGMLWISWPKRASKVPTDIDENVVRGVALAHGLVDVKVCAVDDVWSGLKLVYRLKDRA